MSASGNPSSSWLLSSSICPPSYSRDIEETSSRCFLTLQEKSTTEDKSSDSIATSTEMTQESICCPRCFPLAYLFGPSRVVKTSSLTGSFPRSVRVRSVRRRINNSSNHNLLQTTQLKRSFHNNRRRAIFHLSS